MNPRSCLRWGKQRVDIFSKFVLRWISTRKLLKNLAGQGTSFNGKKQQRIDLNADHYTMKAGKSSECRPRFSMFKRRLITADQASVFMAMMSDHNSSYLAPQRQEMSIENVSSGLVPHGQKAVRL
ncbi:hypothetical protein Tco_0552094 [Tanacetum coccineum]